jgi:hypothetical protein
MVRTHKQASWGYQEEMSDTLIVSSLLPDAFALNSKLTDTHLVVVIEIKD